MLLKDIISEIEKQKDLPYLRFRIKDQTETFTKDLFLILFDADTPVEENLQKLSEDFKQLVELVCWEPEKTCDKMWQL